jgi:hypothetical protein
MGEDTEEPTIRPMAKGNLIKGDEIDPRQRQHLERDCWCVHPASSHHPDASRESRELWCGSCGPEPQEGGR